MRHVLAADTTYTWGNDIGGNLANCDGCGSQWDNKQTAPVGSFKPNASGFTTCTATCGSGLQDSGTTDYHGAPTDGSRQAKDGCRLLSRVIRGGSWNLRSGVPPLRRPPRELTRLPATTSWASGWPER